MTHIKKVSISQGEETLINEFATDKYVYIEANGKDVIYLSQDNKSYNVNHYEKAIHPIDTSSIQNQIHQIRTLLPKLSEDKCQSETDMTTINLEGRNKDSIIMATLNIKKAESLVSTCYYDFFEYNKKCSLLPFEIKKGEILYSMELNLNIQGNLNKTSLRTKNIETIKDDLLRSKFDFIFSKYERSSHAMI